MRTVDIKGPLVVAKPLGTGTNGELRPSALIFLSLLWLSLLVAFGVLVTLLITIFIEGQNKLTMDLITNFPASTPDNAGARPAILGSIWVIITTAVLAIPIGIAAAVHLEEFADSRKWYNRLVELNVQNLAAVPSIVYGLLALAFLALLGVGDTNIVIGGAFALTLLILPVIIISTREALRGVPREIRDGSLALGATEWQTTWRQTLPAAVPGIATGSILALSRALGEAAPLLVLGALVYITFDPNGLLSGYTTLPIQIFNWTGRPQEGFHELAAATSVLLLVVLLLMNGLAIFIRNKFQKRW
ncbi:MAG: phosphate ABC transporter, permease protein PstA [Microbacterium sp. SCN 70-200]|uniref:phosphate ABC transporter permease PstA n=1 Tax=unclassified Microbacterium TaxID=2609290 RepID=UPI000868CECA|nr:MULTISPECIES: phosphate ABC transporter permease PstA [unclassified Microbacterium]MBN9216272.1 phosphate ABC transporter permease PstA [Microbacterium sp.]ODT41305.1 MAG: phosphate ABC transporter, permease protein PstA [Microbacterium sp. SCN 70-200]OJV81716.1 MAG: phosphate ABC transporter, permease protein PstA [Microbacterium sp. 70-16]